MRALADAGCDVVETITGDSAAFSQCGSYRYALRRVLGPGRNVLGAVMLNPSTADAFHDDPTIRKLKGFAKRWGCGELLVANLYAWRATKPTELSVAEHPVGEHNNAAIDLVVSRSGTLLYAWGSNKAATSDRAAPSRLALVASCAEHGRYPVCLGVSERTGQPNHPLYIPYARDPVPYEGTL